MRSIYGEQMYGVGVTTRTKQKQLIRCSSDYPNMYGRQATSRTCTGVQATNRPNHNQENSPLQQAAPTVKTNFGRKIQTVLHSRSYRLIYRHTNNRQPSYESPLVTTAYQRWHASKPTHVYNKSREKSTTAKSILSHIYYYARCYTSSNKHILLITLV